MVLFSTSPWAESAIARENVLVPRFKFTSRQRRATKVPRRAPTVAANCTKTPKSCRATVCTARTWLMSGMASGLGFTRGGSAANAGFDGTSFLRSAQPNMALSCPWQRTTTDADSPNSSCSFR